MNLLSVHLRLSDLNDLVAEVFDQAFPGPFWVIAEIAAVNSAGGAGHTYLDLVEKRGDEIVAQSRANLWRSRRDVLVRFERITRLRLERGMQVLLLAQPGFHRRYGYALDIQDIDPNFTLGDMARRRQEVIDRLTDEGLIDRNPGLILSPAPQRIAAISSITAAGWQDFEQRLARNPYGYAFFPTLFPALVQGEGAEASILGALAEIRKNISSFDCVVLMRGGGGTVDLACFDGYRLARAIAEFPLPVICGIGHERDTCVCDMVAHHAAATPTAAAEFVISRVSTFEDELVRLAGSMLRHAQGTLAREDAAVAHLVQRFRETVEDRVRDEAEALQGLVHGASTLVRTAVARRGSELTALTARIELLPGIRLWEQHTVFAYLQRDVKVAAERVLERCSNDLTLLDRDVRSRDPSEVLRRGYSITRVGRQIVRNVSQVAMGAHIETQLHRGRIESVVQTAVDAENERMTHE
jgi:exodeoxyribonuclease VII large subunit